MRHQWKGFLSSLAIHTFVISLMVIIGSTQAFMNKTVLIDLTLLGPVTNNPGGSPPPSKESSVEKKEPAATPRPEKLVPKPKIVPKAPEPEKVVKHEPQLLTPVEDQGSVPIPSPPPGPTELSDTQPAQESSVVTNSGGTGTGNGGFGGGVGTGGGGGSAEELRNKYLSEHFAYIKDIIQENIIYPPRAQRMGWQGKVIIDFIIMENGSAANIKIAKSSGFVVLDNNVIETVKAVAPFPKPPIKAELRVPIIYRLE